MDCNLKTASSRAGVQTLTVIIPEHALAPTYPRQRPADALLRVLLSPEQLGAHQAQRNGQQERDLKARLRSWKARIGGFV